MRSGTGLLGEGMFSSQLQLRLPAFRRGRPIAVWRRSHRSGSARSYCPECRHGATNQRLVDIAASAGVTAHSAAFAEDGSLRVAFSDGHASTFAPRWLELHSRSSEPDGSRLRRISSLAECLEAQGGPALPESQRPLPLDAPPRAPWAAIEEGGPQLAGVLRNFRRHGAVVLEGAATGDDVIERLAQALGGERATHYGARFHVLSKQQPDSLANTGHALGYHTDLPYRAEVPSVQALHCQQSDAEGGLSLLTDGFAAAEQLYKDDPMVSGLEPHGEAAVAGPAAAARARRPARREAPTARARRDTVARGPCACPL